MGFLYIFIRNLPFLLRKKVVRAAKDQNLLTEIASSDRSLEIRFAALKKLQDENQLAIIAQKDANERMRMKAVRKVRTQEILCDIARRAQGPDVRKEAVRKISNTRLLSDLAKTADFPDVKEAARTKLKPKRKEPRNSRKKGQEVRASDRVECPECGALLGNRWELRAALGPISPLTDVAGSTTCPHCSRTIYVHL